MTDDPEEGSAPPELVKAIADAVSAATRGDDPALRDAMDRAADVDFPAGIAFACYSWARVAASAILGSSQALIDYPSSDRAAGVQFSRDGRVVNAEDTDVATRFVGRMVACAFNDDHHAALDVWQTVPEDDWADCSVAMVRFTASALKQQAVRGKPLI